MLPLNSHSPVSGNFVCFFLGAWQYAEALTDE